MAILGTFFLLLIAVNVVFYITTEYLWFASLGFSSRFWIEIITRLALFAAGGAVAGIFTYFNLKMVHKRLQVSGMQYLSLAGSLGVAIVFGLWALGWWNEVLLYLNQAPSPVSDPVFNRGTAFYLFTLPLYSRLHTWLMFLVVIAGAGVFGMTGLHSSLAQQSGQSATERITRYRPIRKQLSLLGGLVLLLLAWGYYLRIFQLLHSTSGVVTGAGWLDIHVRRPAYIASIVIFVVSAALLFWSAFSASVTRRLFFLRESGEDGLYVPTGKTLIPVGSVVALLFVINSVIPGLFTALYVDPNEITLEEPYIAHNISFTQRAFGLEESHIERSTIPVNPRIDAGTIERNEESLENIRLWDWRALQSNLSQRQEIRLYYRFHDIDIDRYRINGDYRQMMLSLRELDKSELPENAQTWVSRQLKYTHGYGMVMLPANEFQADGQPNLLMRNIPVQQDAALQESGFNLTRPEIYYGELTNDHVYVRTTEEEFDYPGEDENVFVTYEGDGGVPIDGLLKRFIFAWKYDGARQFFSGYFTPESRIMFHREISRRLSRVAPFLLQDSDPYPFVTDDGRIKFIVDTYIVSSDYPYSERYFGRVEQFNGANYVRNSVKAVIDAYDGSVELYVTDPDDIIIRSYRDAFPGLFRDLDDMPAPVRDHIRYPGDYLTAQAEVYRVYHMNDPRTFYQREDVWEFATERYNEDFQDVIPYYIMLRFPGGDLEFVLMLPFTPLDRNVMNAWMAGHADAPNYGDLTVYTFPKGVEVLGPRQIEARVDQNAQMSQQLSLWDQRGSNIIRGNLLTVPLFRGNELSILFAEPIFLEATGAELPEIRRIILADQDNVFWSPNLEGTLNMLIGREVLEAPGGGAAGAAGRSAGAGALQPRLQGLIDDAVEAFNRYRQDLAEGSFRSAGEALDTLSDLINEIESSSAAGPAAAGGDN